MLYVRCNHLLLAFFEELTPGRIYFSLRGPKIDAEFRLETLSVDVRHTLQALHPHVAVECLINLLL